MDADEQKPPAGVLNCVCRLQVIRTLDPKQNQGSGPEVQALKNQLQEKDRMLHSLEVISPSAQRSVLFFCVFFFIFSYPGALVPQKAQTSDILVCYLKRCGFCCFLQTERDGQNEKSEGLRGETHRVSLVQHGKRGRTLLWNCDLLFLFFITANFKVHTGIGRFVGKKKKQSQTHKQCTHSDYTQKSEFYGPKTQTTRPPNATGYRKLWKRQTLSSDWVPNEIP